MASRTIREPINWTAVRAVMAKDLAAVRRSKPIVLPMLIVPFLMLVVLPTIIGYAARHADEHRRLTFPVEPSG